MNKHIVKPALVRTNEQTYRETYRGAYTLMRTLRGGFVFGLRDPLWVSVGQNFIFGALYPSMSGLMNKHIVKLSPVRSAVLLCILPVEELG